MPSNRMPAMMDPSWCKIVASTGKPLCQELKNGWSKLRPILTLMPILFPAPGSASSIVLGGASKLSVAILKIRGTLDRQMEERRTVLRYYLTIILSAIMAAGSFGGLGISLAPWISLGVALFFLLGAALYSQKSKEILSANFAERIDDLRQPFAESLANDYKEGVREFYVEYGGLFEIVRRRIADQKLLLKPRLERWNNLFLELKAIEQEI